MNRFPEETTGIAIVVLAIVFSVILVGCIYSTAGELCAHRIVSFC